MAQEQVTQADVTEADKDCCLAVHVALYEGRKKGASTDGIDEARKIVAAHRLASTKAQAEAAEKMAEALRECLLEHGGYTIKGRCERLARQALSTWESCKQ